MLQTTRTALEAGFVFQPLTFGRMKMIPRYEDARITHIFSDMQKVLRWQQNELAVIEARVNLGLVPKESWLRIHSALEANLPDIAWWKARDKEIGHDLNAFLDERRRFIPVELQHEWHKHTTSYDTEEAPQALALIESGRIVEQDLEGLFSVLIDQAGAHRFTVMLERTHGQHAKLRSFGGRMLTYLAELKVARELLQSSLELCHNSRLSGAIGNFGGGLTPELEKEALRIMGLMPFPAPTQITPRVIYAPLAFSLLLICEVVGKMALDVRLSARSGRPLCHEPFGKKQKGSSAMPHKKNTILTEQMTGMVRLARGFIPMLVSGIETWEGRSIEQSCVERVAWPDLFHVTLRMLSVMTKVMKGLAVYPDNMLREIVESAGTYASDEAKNFLAERCAERNVGAETAYRIVQLAAFNVLRPKGFWEKARVARPQSFEDADDLLLEAKSTPVPAPISIQHFIPQAELFPTEDVEASEKEVEDYNLLLSEIFSDAKTRNAWHKLFKPSHLLQGEAHLFKVILGT